MEYLNEAKVVFIDEESYQQIKKDLCKKDDYFSMEQLEKIIAIFIATPKKSYKKI